MNCVAMKNVNSLSSISEHNSIIQKSSYQTNELGQKKFVETAVGKGNKHNNDYLSVYNDVIVANLQQYYREKQEWSALDDLIFLCLHETGKIPSNEEMKILNGEDLLSESQEAISPKKYFEYENEFDDEILRMILDHD